MSFFIKTGLWRKGNFANKGELDLSAVAIRASVKSDFNGIFSLNNEIGTFWQPFTQTEDITFSEGIVSMVGGADYIKLTASGDAITVPGSWINIGGTEIDPTDGVVHRIMVLKTATEILYTVSIPA